MDLFFATASILGIAGTAIGAVTAVTAWGIRWFAPVRSCDAASLGFHGLLGTAIVFGWIVFLFGLSLMLQPHALGLLLGIALAITIALTVIQRVRSDRDALAAAMIAVMAEGGRPADAARAFAAHRRDTLAVRAKTFADVCESGVPPIAAAVRSGMPMSGTLRALLERLSTPQVLDDDEPVWNNVDPIDAAFHRLLYCVMAIAALSGFTAAGAMFVQYALVPIFDALLEEMAAERSAWRDMLSTLLFYSSIILLILSAVTIAATLARWLAAMLGWQSLGMWIPFFGRIWRVRRRADALQLIARYTSMGRSSSELKAAARSSGDPGLAEDIGRFVSALERGQSVSKALCETRLIRHSEQGWVGAAESTGRVGRVLAEIAAAYRRRAAYRTYLFTEAAIPIFIFGVQIPIALSGLLVFDCLVAMIGLLA